MLKASLQEIYGKSTQFILWTTIISIVGISFGTFLFWIILRRLIIKPLHAMERSAQALSEGDLSFKVDIKKDDEIGRVSTAINSSAESLSNILQRVKNGSQRVSDVTERVETDFKQVSFLLFLI